jgi:C-terminal processing protease CtpA/Prc
MRVYERRRWLVALAVLLSGCAWSPQDSQAQDDTWRAQAVESVAGILEDRYPWPDTAQMISAHLRARHGSGAYASLATLPELAQALTFDIRSVHPDLHLGVRHGPMRPPSGASGDAIERVERLDGDIGYLKLGMISGSEHAFASVADALKTLDGTAAMILDMRGMPGGSAAMANFLISHFTPPGVLSLAVQNRATGQTNHRYTLDEVPGPRRTEVPLYVLVDGRSASAAEDIPFVLQNLGRATIVGERTVGAGRNVQGVPGALGLTVLVSTTRVFDPATGREWERVGVGPDITTTSEDALAAALEHGRAGAAAETRATPAASPSAIQMTSPAGSETM